MDTPQPPVEPPIPELDDAQAGLLRVAQSLYAAAGTAEQINVNHAVDDQLIEFEVKTVLWEALSLLPPGLRLDSGERSDHHTGDRRDDLRSTLRAAAQELRRGPLTSFPAGTSTLLSDLTALIARIDASPPSQTSGRSPR
ncbi:hypothetical protein [uncultured Friedmanniella sp.]|uniref:hypothetical protein n=1 Tax=uncultured Friedmanniella sp. TaxID=335381 RepID=UPI0035CAE2F6